MWSTAIIGLATILAVVGLLAFVLWDSSREVFRALSSWLSSSDTQLTDKQLTDKQLTDTTKTT